MYVSDFFADISIKTYLFIVFGTVCLLKSRALSLTYQNQMYETYPFHLQLLSQDFC